MTPRCRRSSFALLPVAIVAALTLAFPVSAYATQTVGLSSGTFKFSVGPGETVGGEVIVSNDGDEPLKVLVYSSDQTVDDKGNITFVAPNRSDLTAMDQPSTWARVSMPSDSKSLGNIPYLELEPGQQVPVQFSYVVPPSVAPGDHNALIFFEMFELPEAGEGLQSKVSGRLGTRVTLRVKGEIVEKLEVRPFVVPSFVIGTAAPYEFTVRNFGNVDVRTGARAMLLDRNDSEVVTQTAIDGRVVFAGTNLETTGTLSTSRQPFGPMKVRIDVTPVDEDGNATNAGKDTITEVRTVWMVPMWLVIAAGVLLVLVVARLIWMLALKSVRKSQEKAEKRPIGVPDMADYEESEPSSDE